MRFLSTLIFAAAIVVGARPAGAQSLVKFASLPADTFAPGPTSGQLIPPPFPVNGRTPPFIDKQPVQGFSSVLRASNGDYLAMSDNGFGAKPNSPDYLLRVSRIHPDFRTAQGGSGAIAVEQLFVLSDPFNKVNFAIVAEATNYPGSSISVDPAIRSSRLLTGGDFDIESFREAHDGTYWFGDEFGPFLIHTDRLGRVLEAPIPLPGVQSPQNPFLGGAAFNLPGSRGFEGMSIAPNGKTLYPMLEGALTTDPDQRHLIINEFDVRARAYTGQQWHYRLENAAHSMGDLTADTKTLMLVIERDNLQGAAARFKKLFLVDLDEVGADGFLVKHQVADLMQLRDPNTLGGHGPTLTFPFQTIESVIPLSERELGVLDDNNYPFSSARVPGQPDPNEFIVIRLDRPLQDLPR